MISKIFNRNFLTISYEYVSDSDKCPYHWFIWQENDEIIGYKCILSNCGSYNNIFQTKEYHVFKNYFNLKELKFDLIQANKYGWKNIFFEKTFVRKDNNFMFRQNDDLVEYQNVLKENVINIILSNITNNVLTPNNEIMNNYCKKTCAIMLPKKYHLGKIMLKISKNTRKRIDKYDKYIKMYEDGLIKTNKKEKELQKMKKKREYLFNKLKYFIYVLIRKIIDMLENLIKNNNFRHGDLKLNNILADKTKNIDELKIYMIDFGNSSIKYENDYFITENYSLYLLRKKEYDDLAFFILHTFYYFSYSLNNYFGEIFSELVELLYTKKPLDVKMLERIIKVESWALYLSDKNIVNNLKDDEMKNKILYLIDMKYSFKENYKEIIDDYIVSYKKLINKII